MTTVSNSNMHNDSLLKTMRIPFRKLPKYKYSKLTWKTWL